MSIAGTPRVTPELIGGLLLRRQIDASLLGGVVSVETEVRR